ncbi:MAG TPA: ATP-binding cassette domain-containing protein [Candidatus Deferrimicrobiaceae bacterium]|nr:ATP-binding cassette domain-containing protein [Candidatus Deferrimicrobiaceae bacterium]
MQAIEVEELVKVYAGGTRAVDGVSFAVEDGEFFGFLGPNGAGKTTTIRILATLLRATSGRARVAGLDVAAEPGAVRTRIGFAIQAAAIDPMATGRESLDLIGRLYRVPGPERRRRVDELLALMALTDVANRYAGTYSGGMKRRLDLASALVHRPAVLFLDEPTEGLDPQSRLALWDELRRIRERGTTMFLTTHDMEEADRLCSRIAIIDRGRIVVTGSPAELKHSVEADTVELLLAEDRGDGLAHAQDEVARRLAGFEPMRGLERTSNGVRLAVVDAGSALPELFRRLDGDGVTIRGLALSEPTLADVFLRYTGREIRTEAADQAIEFGWWG